MIISLGQTHGNLEYLVNASVSAQWPNLVFRITLFALVALGSGPSLPR